jgi:tight adherence protein B
MMLAAFTADPLLTLAAGTAGMTVALLLAGAASVTAGRSAGRIRGRLDGVLEHGAYVPMSRDIDMLRDRRSSRFTLLDGLLRGRAFTDKTRLLLQQAGLRLRVGEYLLVRVLVALVMTGVGMMVGMAIGGPAMFAAAPVGAAAGVVIPPMLVKRRAASRRKKMEGQLVELCELMSSMLISGFGYMQALTSAAVQLDAPLSEEVKRLVDAVQIGGDADEALNEMTRRLPSRDLEIMATAISIHRSTGGDLSEILRSVGTTIRDRQSFARDVAALTSRERYSAIIVAGFPVLITGVLTLLVPDTFGVLFTTFTGRLILAAALTLDIIGYLAIKRIARIKV